MFTLLIVIIVLALIFDYINGFHDAANSRLYLKWNPANKHQNAHNDAGDAVRSVELVGNPLSKDIPGRNTDLGVHNHRKCHAVDHQADI